MNQRYTFFLLAAACGCGANAQITLNDPANVPTIGSSFLMDNVTGYSAPLPGGAGVNFDYSAVVGSGTRTLNIIDPDAYSNPAAFPNAELAVASPSDTIFYQVTANGIERVGERQMIVAFDVEVPLSDPSLNLKLPLAYGEDWNDNIEGAFSVNGDPGTRSGTIDGEADGWGYLTLPGSGSPIEVLRVYTLTQELNTIETDFLTVTVNHKHREYAYYASFLKMPLLRWYTDTLVASVGGTSGTAGIEWLDPTEVGMLEASSPRVDFSLYPNPAQEQLTVNLSVPAGAGAMLVVSDASGRVVLSERMPSGTTRRELDTRSLATGCYSVTVTDRDGSHGTARLVKH